MKRFSPELFLVPLAALFLAIACQNSTEDNRPLVYDSLDVNFAGTLAGASWSPDDVVGVFATCTRDGAENTAMSSKTPACFHPVSQTTEGVVFNLVKKDEGDNIRTYAKDHNFKFYAYAPYDASITDVSRIAVNVPSKVDFTPGMKAGGLYVAKNTASSVVAAVPLAFKSVVCSMRLRVPSAIVDEEGGTVLRSLVIRPADESAFDGSLAYKAVYNLNTDEITPDPSSLSKTITVDFGSAGTPLTSSYTDVNLLVAPFTVPEGGFELAFTDVNGFENVIPFLAKNAGKEYPAGSAITETVSTSSDGVIPCSSPVEWPIGIKNDAGVFTPATQPMWIAETNADPYALSTHIWTNPTQAQATITYVMGENHPANFRFENNTFKQYNYSSPCVKGLWTGDYFDIDVPVKKVAAGTTVTLTIPSYSRGGSLFWDVEYLDGEEWKCNRESFTSPDGQFTKDCTLMIEHGNRDGSFEGITYKVQFTLQNAIKSGHIRIHLKVADGHYVSFPSATYSTECRYMSEEDWPGRDIGAFLFAFVNKSGKTTALSVEW